MKNFNTEFDKKFEGEIIETFDDVGYNIRDDIKQFFTQYLAELEKELVGEEDNSANESWATNSYDDAQSLGKMKGYNQKRARDIEIFNKIKQVI